MSGSLQDIYKAKRLKVIHVRGELNEVQLEDGSKRTRQPFFFVPEYGGLIEAAPYDNHFIFANPIEMKDYISFQCTCGSPAVAVGSRAYAKDASPTDNGLLMVCLVHQTTGKHADKST